MTAVRFLVEDAVGWELSTGLIGDTGVNNVRRWESSSLVFLEYSLRVDEKSREMV